MDLYVTYCAGEKKEDGTFPPDELYQSERIARFLDHCRAHNLQWAILSAEYGLFFPKEQHASYDTTFKTVNYECRVKKAGKLIDKAKSRQHFSELITLVRDAVSAASVEHISFYAPAPQRAKCYLLLIHKAVDECEKPHKLTREIKSCIRDHGRVTIVRKIDEVGFQSTLR